MNRNKSVVLAVIIALLLSACGATLQPERDYGVFLGLEGHADKLKEYNTVVIDAQYYSEKEIQEIKDSGTKVYSYINVGSLENFRDYYDEYKDLSIGVYEHWEDECWIDVSDDRWQRFITGRLMPELLEKEIDGFFVDNCDVYYVNNTEEILEGLAGIMRALVDTGKEVVINSGNDFLDAYCAGDGDWDDVITGINQESVFSKIIWDENRFGTADEDDREFFTDYIERYAAKGADIYLLEYTKDKKLIAEIDEYCKNKGFKYYVSDSLELK
ncbi:endo alpha-1,4 polygalactosaminidase [Butyrivibrio sp. XPD2006]|uniref:endo alpha-1,4 polygalactosaminidase n=1 Tax=Butyrivibrio sp. XPD2006 TaxID=1280668 RepID=UPI0004002AFC|nr:endo alpha-1,4 polygalactosaminidase [Butyrivibrio sp. XPD2006]